MAHTPASIAFIEALGLDPAEVTNVSIQIVEGEDPKARVHMKVSRVVEVRDALVELTITEKESR